MILVLGTTSPGSDEWSFKSVQEMRELIVTKTLMKLLLPKEVRLVHHNHIGSRLYFPERSAPRVLQLQRFMVCGHNTVKFAHAFIPTKIQLREYSPKHNQGYWKVYDSSTII